eukprot:161216-Rhodomonas_salina.2
MSLTLRNQSLLVYLPVDGLRELVHRDHEWRNHVAGQRPLQVRLACFHAHSARHHKLCQRLRLRPQDHHSFSHPIDLEQLVLDLPFLDPVPPHFDLFVDPAQELDRLVRQPPTKIPGLVDPCVLGASVLGLVPIQIRVGYKLEVCQVRPVVVAESDLLPRDAKLPWNSDRQATVGCDFHHVAPKPIQWPANRSQVSHASRAHQGVRPHAALRRSVLIDNTHAR